MPEALRFSEAEKVSFRKAHAPNANDEQWQIFIQECERRALIPGTHVVFQLRNASEYNASLNRRVSVQKVTLITTINALRLIAERAGKYVGHGPFIFYYGTDDGSLKESKIPLGKIPHAVSVEGFRKDWQVPLFATARYDAYAQMKDDGGKKVPTMMWAAGTGRGEEQLAKCCEALMLKTVSPEECANLFISEELGNDVPEESPLEALKAIAGHGTGPMSEEEAVRRHIIPAPIVAPQVNQAPCSRVSEAVLESAPQHVAITAPPVPCAVVPEASDFFSEPEPAPSSLFLTTKHPDPKDETRVFEKPLAVNPEVKKALEEVKPAPVAAPIVPAALNTAPVVEGDAPATQQQYTVFINQRAAKIIRDKMKGISWAGTAVKNYLLKGSGKAGLNKISAADFERLLIALDGPGITVEQITTVLTPFK